MKAHGRALLTAINKDAQFCPDFQRKAKGTEAEGGGGGGVKRSCQVALKKKSSLPKREKVPVGCCLGSALARRVNSAVVSSAFASGRVWGARSRRLSPGGCSETLNRCGEARTLPTPELEARKFAKSAGCCRTLEGSGPVPDAAAAEAAAETTQLQGPREEGLAKGGGRKYQPAALLTETRLQFTGPTEECPALAPLSQSLVPLASLGRIADCASPLALVDFLD